MTLWNTQGLLAGHAPDSVRRKGRKCLRLKYITALRGRGSEFYGIAYAWTECGPALFTRTEFRHR